MRNMVLWPNMLLGNINILHQQNNWLGGSSLVVQLGRAPDNLEPCSAPCHGFNFGGAQRVMGLSSNSTYNNILNR